MKGRDLFMQNQNEKKGLLNRLTAGKKAKKSSCCCNFEIEEIPEEKTEKETQKPTEKGKGGSCCG